MAESTPNSVHSVQSATMAQSSSFWRPRLALVPRFSLLPSAYFGFVAALSQLMICLRHQLMTLHA